MMRRRFFQTTILLFVIWLGGGIINIVAAVDPAQTFIPKGKSGKGITRLFARASRTADYRHIATCGNRVFVANDASLESFELVNSDSLRPNGTFRMDATIEALEITDQFLFIALGKKGFRVYRYDWKSESYGAPAWVEISELISQSIPANLLAIEHQTDGTDLAIAVGSQSVDRYAISKQGQLLTHLSRPFSGSPKTCKIGYHQAYLLDRKKGILCFDLSKPDSIRLTSTIPTPRNSITFTTHDSLLYLIDRDDGFQIYRMTDPSHPMLLSSSQLTSPGEAIVLKDSVVFIGTGSSGIVRVFVVANPAKPVEVGTVESVGGAYDLSLLTTSFGYRFALAEGNFIGIYDCADIMYRINELLEEARLRKKQ